MALFLFATPALADPVLPSVETQPARARAFVTARYASEAGADAAATRRFTDLLAAEPASKLVAQRALDHGLRIGNFGLALAAARRLDTLGGLMPLRRLLLVAEAVRTRRWAVATREIDRLATERVLDTMVPVLRAWVAFGKRDRDPAALLAPMASGPLASYGVEHQALIALAQGRGDATPFLALDAGSGLRPQRLRLAAAAEFAARGNRPQALALAAGDQPAMIAARGLIEAGRPLPGRIDSAAEGMAEFLCRVAIDFNQQQLGAEGAILARIATYLASDNSEGAMIAAELIATSRPTVAVAVLRTVAATDPFGSSARDLRLQYLATAGLPEAALAEVTARTNAGSTAPSDWVQLGNLQSDAGRHAEAAQTFVRAHELWRAHPDPTIREWSLWLLRGGALEKAGRWADGRAALAEAFRLAPDEPLVLNYYGFAQLDRGEALEDSERMVRRALDLAPGNAAITDSLGWALYRRGRLDEAIPMLERAARGAPADVEINDHLGDAYWTAGQRLAARYAWRAALVQADGGDVTRIRAKIDGGLPATH